MSDFNSWFFSLPKERQEVLREDKWMLANAAFEHAQAERDALVAQVAAQQVLLKCWQTWLGSSRESCDDSGAKLWDKIEEACNAKPQHHLASHDAEVAAKAVDAFIDYLDHFEHDGIELRATAEQYFDQLKTKVGS